MDLGYGKSFHTITSEHLLQMTVFEEMVELDIFYRDPKNCFSPRTIETIQERRYRKETKMIQQDNLSLLKRKHGVAQENERDNKLEN